MIPQFCGCVGSILGKKSAIAFSFAYLNFTLKYFHIVFSILSIHIISGPMKILLIIFFSFNSYAGLVSPFCSTVEEIDIPNTHMVTPRIYRGMAPLGKIDQLLNFGITDILIFKNQTRNEIDKEYEEIVKYEKEREINLNTIQMDFFWHKFPSYKKACEQTIDAFRLFRSIQRNENRKMYFHCTVGEDRTGYLAGLWQMLKQGKSKKTVFYEQMCSRGYERGNPNKPTYVINEIRKDLTPLFMYMANLVETKKISMRNLTKKHCKDDIPVGGKMYTCKEPAPLCSY